MKDPIKEFDLYLAKKELSFNAIIIGGAALVIMDIISRYTKDVDCLDPDIPQVILEAAVSFAKETFDEFQLSDDWLNNGPVSLKRDLPDNWRERTQLIFTGKALTFYTLGRLDLLKSKLYACCDRGGNDFNDCVALSPTADELESCYEWVLKGDANPLWEAVVKEMFEKIAAEVSNG